MSLTELRTEIYGWFRQLESSEDYKGYFKSVYLQDERLEIVCKKDIPEDLKYKVIQHLLFVGKVKLVHFKNTKLEDLDRITIVELNTGKKTIQVGQVYRSLEGGNLYEIVAIATLSGTTQDLVIYKNYYTKEYAKYAYDENVNVWAKPMTEFTGSDFQGNLKFTLIEPKPEEFMNFRQRSTPEVSKAIFNAVICDCEKTSKNVEAVEGDS